MVLHLYTPNEYVGSLMDLCQNRSHGLFLRAEQMGEKFCGKKLNL